MDVVKVVPPIGPSSELTHAGRPYELTLLVSTVLVFDMYSLTRWQQCNSLGGVCALLVLLLILLLF